MDEMYLGLDVGLKTNSSECKSHILILM